MDFVVDLDADADLRDFRAALTAHLDRHAAGDVPDGAADAACAALAERLRAAGGRGLARLDWTDERPKLHLVIDAAELAGFDYTVEVRRSAGDIAVPRPSAVAALLSTLEGLPPAGPATRASARSDTSGDSVRDSDGDNGRTAALLNGLLPTALAHAAESDIRAPATFAHSMADVFAATALRNWRDRPEGTARSRHLGDLFLDHVRELGGAGRVERADEEEVEVVVTTCPFGPSVSAAPHLCSATAAVLGVLATRDGTEATVSMPERIALGDPACRLVARLGDGEESTTRRRFAGADDAVGTDGALGPSPLRLRFDLVLPRDELSVPVSRKVAHDALTNLGVVESDVSDITLALTEACANVLHHAGPTDSYVVELDVHDDECVLRVIDTGHGLDSAALDAAEARGDTEAESGRGLSLMRALVDGINLVSEPESGTIVNLVKNLSYRASAPAVRLMSHKRAAVGKPPLWGQD